MITVYGIPNCDTVKKARTWLADQGLEVAFHDFKKQGVPAAELPAWLKAFGRDRIVNRAGTTWRKLDEAARAGVVDDASATALMLAEPSVIKRPVVRWADGSLTLGFKPEAFAAKGRALMFTGIVQGVARVDAIDAREGLHTLHLKFPDGFDADLAIGASVSCDGVCLTVTERPAPGVATFDVMAQTLGLTTLGGLTVGSGLNVERAAKEGVEIGGHPLSGHVDVSARIAAIRRPDNNHVIRFALPAPWMRYVFAKGYIGVNGCSLTVAEAQRERDGSGWFEVWLIPETLRMTTFGDKAVGDAVHIEIERSTQVVVDTVRDALDEKLGPLLPVLEAIAKERGIELTQLVLPKS